MNKIRKGSIVIDTITGEITKVLSKPLSGELPDGLMKITGYHKMPHFKDFVLLKRIDRTVGKNQMTYNNIPCYIRALYCIKLSKHSKS